MIQVEIANEQSKHVFDADLLRDAVRVVLRGESVDRASVSVAVVDDASIHVLNRKYLQHDYATDVLSFLLSAADESLEGEVILSADTAAREAVLYAWTIEEELLLYVIHGTLHLVGYDDASEPERSIMRTKEREYLTALGRQPIDDARATTRCDVVPAERPADGATLS
ncbi:MAG TPA: rRNA maturation RNase YbeY [Pirellulaceae bacterium]|nr:rRNA maturation RNase YbeY [Pirellulaceae bacterium]